MKLRSNQLKLLENTREDFRDFIPLNTYRHALHLRHCVCHFINYGKEDNAYKSTRELAHIFLLFLNRPYSKFSKEEC